MKLEDIYRFFQEPQPTHLNGEAATAYVVFVLLQRDSYGTELLQWLEREYPGYRLSDTILFSAIQFLESEGWINHYWQRLAGRGRPRRMLCLNPEVREEAQKLAQLWQNYAGAK